MTNVPASETPLEALQDKALHLGLEINDAEGKPLPEDVLRAKVTVAEAEAEEGLSPEQREHAKAKANEALVAARAREQAASSLEAIPDNIQPQQFTSNAASPRLRRTPKLEPSPVNPDRAKLSGLPEATDEDLALARHFGYPVIVPGGKAYVTDVSFRCALGGGERPMGSVVILTDAHARNKMQHLTPVEDTDLPQLPHASARAERGVQTNRPPKGGVKGKGSK